jgi:hypothetical protein
MLFHNFPINRYIPTIVWPWNNRWCNINHRRSIKCMIECARLLFTKSFFEFCGFQLDFFLLFDLASCHLRFYCFSFFELFCPWCFSRRFWVQSFKDFVYFWDIRSIVCKAIIWVFNYWFISFDDIFKTV